jgi:hypothetical protein
MKVRLPAYARPGIEIKVRLEVSAATIEAETTHHGSEWLPER